jgi:hypothetical protein
MTKSTEQETMDKGKLLALMRFWLIGTFLIVFVATTTYVGLFTARDWMLALRLGWPVWGITGLLCIAWYYIYKGYIRRKY